MIDYKLKKLLKDILLVEKNPPRKDEKISTNAIAWDNDMQYCTEKLKIK